MEEPAPYGNRQIDRQRRERIASMAMQGLLAHGLINNSPEHVAMRAVAYTDALIAELDKDNGNPDCGTAEENSQEVGNDPRFVSHKKYPIKFTCPYAEGEPTTGNCKLENDMSDRSHLYGGHSKSYTTPLIMSKCDICRNYQPMEESKDDYVKLTSGAIEA